MAKKEKVIQSNRILLVEGKDEVGFFNALLEWEDIDFVRPDSEGMQEGIQVWDVGGSSKFRTNFPAFYNSPNFSLIETLGIIRDAETSCANTYSSLQGILRKFQLHCPSELGIFSGNHPKVGIFIVPNNKDSGMLEDVCLKTVEAKPPYTCVNQFMQCVCRLEKKPRNPAKAKAQAYLAAMPEIVNACGLGAEKEYWDFSSSSLDSLKTFLHYI